jgi:dihydrofolate reductase
VQPLRYSINITLDGCVDHTAGMVDEEQHSRATDTVAAADALIFGRTTYQLMEAGWKEVARTGVKPDDMSEWMVPFAYAIDKVKKYVVSNTLQAVDWNTKIVRGTDLEQTVRELKAQPGRGLLTGGVQLPLALAEMGLIDEFEFVVHPRIAGRGPTPFAGLSRMVDLTLIDRLEYGSGAVAMRYALRSGGSDFR